MLRISVRKSCRNLSFCQRNTRFAFFLILLNLQSDFTESTVCFYRIYSLFLQNLQSVFTEPTVHTIAPYISPHRLSLHHTSHLATSAAAVATVTQHVLHTDCLPSAKNTAQNFANWQKSLIFVRGHAAQQAKGRRRCGSNDYQPIIILWQQ